MAGRAEPNRIRWTLNRGRNGADTPDMVAEDMCAEALNVVLNNGRIATKRPGSSAQSIGGDTFSGFNALARFSAGQDDTAAQLIILSRDATTKILRVTGGTNATNLTLKDNVSATPQEATFANLNGKIYIAYKSAVDRLHVYDPTGSTSLVRRVGLATPAAPSVANTGAGTYAAVARSYRVQWRTKSGSLVRRQSLPGTAVTFTPSGTGTAARITQPTVPSEGETHWAVYGSADTITYYELAEVAIGTTTYDDSAAPSSYENGTLMPDEGAFTPWPSVKYLAADGNRLLGFGAYESTTKNGRVFFSPVLDSSSTEDDERVSDTTDFKGWIDLQRNGGYEDRGIVGPIDGQFLCGQSRGIYRLVPTGEADAPYYRIQLSNTLGFVSHHSCVMGEDEHGLPAIYFLDPERGPYRYGRKGLEWLGYDVQDVWATIHLDASIKVAHGQYLAFSTGEGVIRRVAFWLATNGNAGANAMIMFHVEHGYRTEKYGVRGGWVKWSGDIANARCATVFPDTFGATMSRAMKMYAGTATTLYRLMDASASDDNGTPFQAYVTSRGYDAGDRQHKKQLGKAWLQAEALNGQSIRQSLISNFSAETRTSDVTLTAAGTETRIFKRFEDADLTDASLFQVQLGDSVAVASGAWDLDEWIGTVERLEEV